MTNTLNILSDPHKMTITVASYGQIALHLGNRNFARMVGVYSSWQS